MHRFLPGTSYGKRARAADSGNFDIFLELNSEVNGELYPDPNRYEAAHMETLNRILQREDMLESKAWAKERRKLNRAENKQALQNTLSTSWRKASSFAITSTFGVANYLVFSPAHELVVKENHTGVRSRPTELLPSMPNPLSVDPTAIVLNTVAQHMVHQRQAKQTASFDPLDIRPIVSLGEHFRDGYAGVAAMVKRGKERLLTSESPGTEPARVAVLAITTGVLAVASVLGGMHKFGSRNN